MAGNESAGIQVKQVFERCGPRERKSIAERFQIALENGDAQMLTNYGSRQKSLEDQVAWVFGLNDEL
jgi:hypothetical protein